MTPEVSVVVPAFNAAAHLDETLRSIRAQTLQTIEILVVDDCSRDGTADIVARHASDDGRVRYLRTPRNSGGPAAPRNLGVAQALAPWIAFCDADDLWDRRKLELQTTFARTNEATIICAGIVDFVDGHPPNRPAVALTGRIVGQRLTLLDMLMKDRIATSSALCDRAALLRAGGFDEARELVAVEDYDLWLRMMEMPDVTVQRLTLALVDYRRSGTSLSGNKLKHARKVARVVRLHFERAGTQWIYPVAAPALLLSHIVQSVWSRVIMKRL